MWLGGGGGGQDWVCILSPRNCVRKSTCILNTNGLYSEYCVVQYKYKT